MLPQFTLDETDKFDARRGYSRWVLPGTGAVFPGKPCANADLWTDKDGRIFVRFSSRDYNYYFEIKLADGSSPTVEVKDYLEDFLQHTLVQWMVEGLDDSPNECL